ncbi:hypothetical protein QR680_018584 [Steinernema hermaphroditum]|uniref:Fibrinogen C-terminal domain-containing protein n=1 Tax=Steinernema hermaphroditum TaxID=289476 RepID=A0AA39LR26_9BILA|nr:hypothetical protein QR680_018584 [Steinernema hermaphroditum]
MRLNIAILILLSSAIYGHDDVLQRLEDMEKRLKKLEGGHAGNLENNSELVKMLEELNVQKLKDLTERGSIAKRRTKREAADSNRILHLSQQLHNLRTELSVVRSLQNQNDPKMQSEISQTQTQINDLLNLTEQINRDLIHLKRSSTLQNKGYMVLDIDDEESLQHIEVENLKERIWDIDEKMRSFDDTFKWNEFWLDRLQKQIQEVVRNQGTIVNKLSTFEKVRVGNLEMVEGSGDENPNDQVNYIFQSHDSDNRHNTKDDLENLKYEISSLQTVTDELSEQLQRRQSFVSSNISELTSSVTDITTKHSSFEAELENIKAIMATNKRSQKGQIDVISLDVKEAKHRSDRAIAVAEVIKKVQQELFTKLVNQTERMREIDAQVTKYALKLTQLQSDFLNATLFLHKTSVYDQIQDEKFYQLKGLVGKLESDLESNTATLKDTETKMQQKADYESIRKIEKLLEKDSSRLSKLDSQVRYLRATQLNAESTIGQLQQTLPNDCSEVDRTRRNVLIKPSTLNKAIFVNCVGGWTVIQERLGDNGTSFNRTSEEYGKGFGNINESFWIGNEPIHHITASRKTEVKFETWDLYGDYRVAFYEKFHVASKEANYRLSIGGYEEKSNLTDAMYEHNGMEFSTYDSDLDKSSTHCGRYYLSGK